MAGPLVLHISADYPDTVEAGKTRAIANLIAAAGDAFDHRVISLNRRSPSPLQGIGSAVRGDWRVNERGGDSDRSDWVYHAPPGGLFLRRSLEAVADAIIADLARSGRSPALVVGHKLTIEGLVARRVAGHFGVPFCVSVQGNTDERILSLRPDLRPAYRRVFHEAAVIFPFTPWALAACTDRLGPRDGPVILLPCISETETIIAPAATPARLMTAFHLRNWRLKGLPEMLEALALIQRSGMDVELDIYGGGAPGEDVAIEAQIARSGARAHLRGPIAHSEIAAEMNRYAAFVMVSRRESFGMVFLEALRAGCPVIYPRGAAIDGYFPDTPFARAAFRRDPRDIAVAIRAMIEGAPTAKAALGRWQADGGAARFSRKCVGADFAAGLSLALAQDKGATCDTRS